jgi:hypothetical protein
MSDHANLRSQLRPHGMIGAGCSNCAFLDVCGGIEPEMSLLDCFSLTCCKKDDCDNVCPNNTEFTSRMSEIGGLRFDDVPLLRQRPVELPKYVPMIHHGYSRTVPLDWPIVALETYGLFHHTNGGHYSAKPQTWEDLRRMFCLHPNTQIILRGTAKDQPLERYWAHHTVDRPAEQLAALRVACAIGPNFSHFLDVPRTDNLFNRKRQLICLAEISKAGISAIPHLSANMPSDWAFWRRYLLLNERVRMVAIELQTGNKAREQGIKVIERVKWLENEIGRQLHLLAIGGSQFAAELGIRFNNFTVIDSTPFMKSIYRQRFESAPRRPSWNAEYSAVGAGIDDLLRQNLTDYTSWIETRTGQFHNSN